MGLDGIKTRLEARQVLGDVSEGEKTRAAIKGTALAELVYAPGHAISRRSRT